VRVPNPVSQTTPHWSPETCTRSYWA